MEFTERERLRDAQQIQKLEDEERKKKAREENKKRLRENERIEIELSTSNEINALGTPKEQAAQEATYDKSQKLQCRSGGTPATKRARVSEEEEGEEEEKGDHIASHGNRPPVDGDDYFATLPKRERERQEEAIRNIQKSRDEASTLTLTLIATNEGF